MIPKSTKDTSDGKKQPERHELPATSSIKPEKLDTIRHASDYRVESPSPEITRSPSPKSLSHRLDALQIYVHPPEDNAQTQAISPMKMDKGPKKPGQDIEKGTTPASASENTLLREKREHVGPAPQGSDRTRISSQETQPEISKEITQKIRKELSSLPSPNQLEDIFNKFKEISSQLLANVRDSHTAKTPIEKQAIFDQIYNHIGQGNLHNARLEKNFQKLKDTVTSYNRRMKQIDPSFESSKSELAADVRFYRKIIAETQFGLEDNIEALQSKLPENYHPYYSLEQVTHSERLPEEWISKLSDASILNGCAISCTVYACLKFNIKYDVSDIQKALFYTPEQGSTPTALSEALYANFGLGGQLRDALSFDTVRQETERGNIAVIRLHKPGMLGHAICIDKVQDTDKEPQCVIWDIIKPESFNTIPTEIIQNLSKGLQEGTLKGAILSPLSAPIPGNAL